MKFGFSRIYRSGTFCWLGSLIRFILWSWAVSVGQCQVWLLAAMRSGRKGNLSAVILRRPTVISLDQSKLEDLVANMFFWRLVVELSHFSIGKMEGL